MVQCTALAGMTAEPAWAHADVPASTHSPDDRTLVAPCSPVADPERRCGAEVAVLQALLW